MTCTQFARCLFVSALSLSLIGCGGGNGGNPTKEEPVKPVSVDLKKKEDRKKIFAACLQTDRAINADAKYNKLNDQQDKLLRDNKQNEAMKLAPQMKAIEQAFYKKRIYDKFGVTEDQVSKIRFEAGREGWADQ